MEMIEKDTDLKRHMMIDKTEPIKDLCFSKIRPFGTLDQMLNCVGLNLGCTAFGIVVAFQIDLDDMINNLHATIWSEILFPYE